MDELIYIARNMGMWVYTIMTAYEIPYINVTPWTLSLSILAFTLALRVADKFTNRNQGQDDNNNKIYRE